MKYKIRSKNPQESEIQYHEEILKEFEKIFNIKIRSNYLSDINMMEYHINDSKTGKNKVIFDGCDCYFEAVTSARTMIEVSLQSLFNYLKNTYGSQAEPETSENIIATFNCPNCGASVEIGSKICPYCHTHFTYLGGHYYGG